MEQNIWEVTSLNDLVKIIQENTRTFSILGLVLKDSDKTEKNIIKRFLKNKHKEYPNLLFLYFQLSDSELKKKDDCSLIKGERDGYPWVYYLHGNDTILVHVNNANLASLYQSFGELKQYYDNDKVGKVESEELEDCSANSDSGDEYDPYLDQKLSVLQQKREVLERNWLKDIRDRKKIEETAKNTDSS